VLKFNLAPKIVLIVFSVAVIGMGAIDLVVIIAQQRSTIQQRIKLAASVAPVLDRILATSDLRDNDADYRMLLEVLGSHEIVCANIPGDGRIQAPLFFGNDCGEGAREAAFQALETSSQVVFTGRTWGVLWMQPKHASVKVSLPSAGVARRSATLIVDLGLVYKDIRRTQKHLFFYMLINALVLTFLGSLRIWQVSGRPIQKLAQRADGYQVSESLLFQPNAEYGSDIARLSRSLNQMMVRIENDRQALRGTVASLEKANAELKKAQSDVIRAEKMASVGRLAAGIAHEIGNPMGIITGYLELLKDESSEASKRAEYIRRAEGELSRINTIIRQLLDFSRPARDEENTPTIVNRVIEDVVDVVSAQPGMGQIDISLQLASTETRVAANEQVMRQVFLNLLLNAADALATHPDQSDKRITVATRMIESHGTSIAKEGKGTLIIEVADNGPGVNEAHLPNLFDPFFTTKEPGKGTGLGLSVCYTIIEGLGGDIEVVNQEGGGTAVVISLPLINGTVSERKRDSSDEFSNG
jgi:two-component system NtrC family sensor kinase